MAWRRLAEGDCGDDSALLKLTSHYTRDHTFSETHGHIDTLPSHSDRLVQEFLQETRAVPQSYRMSDLMKEMQEIESQRLAVPPIPASTVKDHLSDETWAQEYMNRMSINKMSNEFGDHNSIWAEISARERENLAAMENAFISSTLAQVRGDKAVVEDNTALENERNDEHEEYKEFVDFMKKMNKEERYPSVDLISANDVDSQAESWSNEYTVNAMNSNLNEVWDKEKGNVTESGDDYNSKFWDKLQDEWRKLAEQENGEDHPWLSDLEEFSDPYKEYEFAENNPMMSEPSPFEKGKEMLALGDFPSAVLCFEAAVQKDPNNADAWLLLGTTQAENEQDPYAISALKRCIQLQPDNLKAHMALAVSYTNENYHNQACRELVEWLKYNPSYANLVPPDLQLSGQVTSFLDPVQHRTVQDLFIKAAQQRPTDPDYEIQCGLGVLFNLSGEYSKAVDCFRVALNVRPDDARLWNRLGATLANGNRPEEAVEAYHHALNLSPGFIRARYNVGITCINLKAYKEAAEHFLTALNQQARGRTHTGGTSATSFQMSDTIWSTLRMCITLMKRLELKSAVDQRDLNTLNQAFNLETD